MDRRAIQRVPTLTAQPTQMPGLDRALPVEEAVAMVYNGSSLAVMMATPADLQDFALGFALSEGFVSSPDDLGEVEEVQHKKGTELRMWIDPERFETIMARRRSQAGPVGCGLCGIDSIEEAMRPLPKVGPGTILRAKDIANAPDQLRDAQPLQDQTRAAHAAGFLCSRQGLILVREDVGRHNALDKLIGALARGGIDTGNGAVVLTSRVSSEMVQKTVMAGIPTLIAVSAPTALGVQLADEAGLTLVANARGGRFDIYTHSHRIESGDPQ